MRRKEIYVGPDIFIGRIHVARYGRSGTIEGRWWDYIGEWSKALWYKIRIDGIDGLCDVQAADIQPADAPGKEK